MNSVLVDFKLEKEWPFVEVLKTTTSEQWETIECQTNQYHGSKKASLIRFFWYFAFPFKMVLRRKKWNHIVAWQQFYGINFAFWCRLFHLKKINNLTIMTFIYKKKNGIAGWMYHKYMSFAVRSKYVDRFICFSKNESEYYPHVFRVDKSKFIYIPVGIAPLESVDTSDGGYVFATGRSNRDYSFLLKVLEGTDFKCQIVCDTLPESLAAGSTKILTDCHGKEMINRMAHSHCVVIPLKDINVSSGQLVMLQAMSLGKPVICTNADGIKDYTTKDTAIMIPNDVNGWRRAISSLYDEPERYLDMSKSALSLFEKNFTENIMFSNIAKILYKTK